ncbi:transcriptional regulator [Dietzia sp. B19]|uniref:transcriptional regulator n=1 Tax=Dietzia sp. B19 TaxID=1630632 RepID=UPI0015F83C8A|nr:transcriptional regulator [Dietzia sp. B19]MBB1058945.1 transcriptional regulator [Dietzia sp. B19]
MLHTVRLAGFADTAAVADRVDLPADIIGDTLRVLQRQHLIERMTFADSGGWILTEAGKCRDGELLKQELEASGARTVLYSVTEDFESSANSRLVRVVTEWQLHSAPEREDSSAAVLRELTDLADVLHGLMAELVALLPRFNRYPRQFSAALQKACAGDHEWVAGVGRLSCHTVWAELHQDLLSSLGRDRSTEPHQGGR